MQSGKPYHHTRDWFLALNNTHHNQTHFRISLTYHSSSGWNPKKVFPSPPKSQDFITSKDLKGRR